MLKNAGYVPPEVAARREAASLRDLIAQLDDVQERSRAMVRLQLLNLRMAGRDGRVIDVAGYDDALLARFSGAR